MMVDGAEPKKLSGVKQIAWEELSQVIPDLPPYSDHEYNLFLLQDLPLRLADYGIFVKTLVYPIVDAEYDTIVTIEPVVAMYSISRVSKSQRFPERKPLSVDRVDIAGIIREQAGSDLEQKMLPPPAQTFYQNVVVYNDPVDRSSREQDAQGIRRLYNAL